MDNIIGSPALPTPPDSWDTNGVKTCTKREFQKILAFLAKRDRKSHNAHPIPRPIPRFICILTLRVCSSRRQQRCFRVGYASAMRCVCSCPLGLLCLMVRPWRKTSAAAGLLTMILPQHNGDQSSRPDLPKAVAHGSGATTMSSAKSAQ